MRSAAAVQLQQIPRTGKEQRGGHRRARDRSDQAGRVPGFLRRVGKF